MSQSVEDIKRECTLYFNSVIFFASLNKEIERLNLVSEVEHKVKHTNGIQKIPDFSIFDNNKDKITTILEHKASLPIDEKLVFKKIRKCYDSYSTILWRENIQNPDVVVLYPITCQDVIDEIEDEIDFDISLCSFDLNKEEGQLTFLRKRGEVTDPNIVSILNSDAPLDAKPENFSEYKFIRKNPPVIYTAFHLWNVIFRPFIPLRFEGDFYTVSYDNIVRQANTFYPSWIGGDINQISRGRANKALAFLKKIGYIRWREKGQPIEVFPNKGARSGDLIHHFAEKWVKLKKMEREIVEARKRLPLGQKTLSNFGLEH